MVHEATLKSIWFDQFRVSCRGNFDEFVRGVILNSMVRGGYGEF